MAETKHPDRLQAFVDAIDALLAGTSSETMIIDGTTRAMRALVAADDWLPEAVSKPHPTFYQQYLLHCDSQQRFSVVSFVWGPGQATPIHDHTVWGVIGMLRGAEKAMPYHRVDGQIVAAGEEVLLEPGDVQAVSPAIGDIHRVSNAYDDRVSVSIHAYGADIGRVKRHVFDPTTGAAKEFVSGYANR